MTRAVSAAPPAPAATGDLHGIGLRARSAGYTAAAGCRLRRDGLDLQARVGDRVQALFRILRQASTQQIPEWRCDFGRKDIPARVRAQNRRQRV